MNFSAIVDMGSSMGSLAALGMIDRDILVLVSAVSLIFGLLQCFLGYKITKIMYAIMGFCLGWLLTLGVGVMVMAAPDSGSGSATPFLMLLVGLVLSILLAFLMFKLYLVGVFISQFCLSFVIFTAVLGILTNSMNGPMVAIVLVLSLAVAVISVILVRPVIIICTAWSGGIMAGNALATMLQLEGPFGLVLGLLLAIGGAVVQFLTTKKPVAAAAAIPPTYGYPPPPPPPGQPNWQPQPAQPVYQPPQQPAQPVYQAPQQPAPAAPAPAPEETVVVDDDAAETVMTEAPTPPADGSWTCSCGRVNHYRFCEDCGKPRP